MIDVNREGEVWVFAEQHNGHLEDTPLELMSKARHLADTLGVELGAALLGDGVKQLAPTLIHYGADKVYLVEHPLLRTYQTNSYARVIGDLIHKREPQIVLYGATVTGRDLAPRIASAIKAGLTADCTDLQIGDHTTVRDKKLHKNLLFQIRPAFGGNIIATIINHDRWPQMATVREGVMPMPEPDVKRKGQVIEERATLSQQDLPLQILAEHKRPKKVDLKAARVIVAGGAGVGSKENFKLIWDLATAARRISNLSGIWRIAWGRHRPPPEQPWTWALSTRTIKSARPAPPFGPVCISQSESAARSSIRRECRRAKKSSPSIAIPKHPYSRSRTTK